MWCLRQEVCSLSDLGTTDVDFHASSCLRHRIFLMTPAPKEPAPSRNTKLRFNRRPILKFGSTGKDVKILQKRINKLGFSIAVDGIFGIETDTTIRYIQKEVALKPNGIVGPMTWLLLLGVPLGDLNKLRAQSTYTRAVMGQTQVRRVNREFENKLKTPRTVTVAEFIQSRTRGVDSYTSRLIKYIPSEILAVYLTLRSLVVSSFDASKCGSGLLWAYWFIFSFGVLITPFYMWRVQQKMSPKRTTDLGIILISTGAFIAWAIAGTI